MSHTLPSPAFSQPTTPVQVGLEAEILRDADTGHNELIVNDELATPDELREQISAARKRLMHMEALADQYEALAFRPGPCFSWCQHGNEFPDEHSSAKYDLPVPAGLDVKFELLSTQLYHSDDPSLVEHKTFVSIDSGGNGVGMTPDEAEAFADELVTFAARVRDLASQARNEQRGADR